MRRRSWLAFIRPLPMTQPGLVQRGLRGRPHVVGDYGGPILRPPPPMVWFDIHFCLEPPFGCWQFPRMNEVQRVNGFESVSEFERVNGPE